MAQTALQFTPWQTCSLEQHLNFSGQYPATWQLTHKDCPHGTQIFTTVALSVAKYPPLCVAWYSFTQLNELEQMKVE